MKKNKFNLIFLIICLVIVLPGVYKTITTDDINIGIEEMEVLRKEKESIETPGWAKVISSTYSSRTNGKSSLNITIIEVEENMKETTLLFYDEMLEKIGWSFINKENDNRNHLEIYHYKKKEMLFRIAISEFFEGKTQRYRIYITYGFFRN